MKKSDRRLSLLSLPEVKKYYSVPIFNANERDYFFSFTDEELKVVKGFHSHRNRIHFLLMLGYFKVKSVYLIYNWKDIEIDYQYISERYFPKASKQRKNIRPIIGALALGCRGNALLENQIESTKSVLCDRKNLPKMDGRLVKLRDKKYIKTKVNDEGNSEKKIANRNEMYLYKLLYKGINNGDVYVKNSLEYRSFDEYLVKDSMWKQRKQRLFEAGLDWMNQSSEDYLSKLEYSLNEKLLSVGMRIFEGKNSFVKRKSNSNKLRWARAVKPKDKELTEKFFAHFNRKSIVNVLHKVNEETNFLEHFKAESKRNKKSVDHLENLLAVVLANGTFQGTHKFAAISDPQYKVLRRIEEECFHTEALRSANDSITGSAVRLSIFDDFKLNDGKTHSSADG